MAIEPKSGIIRGVSKLKSPHPEKPVPVSKGHNIFGSVLFNLIKILNYLIILAIYDEYTIARHFRKQGAKVGDNCRIFIRSLGDEPYLVRIGDHVTIASGVTFVTHDGGAWSGRLEVPDLQVFGPIEIGDNCVIGQNVILFPNITIGDNCIIGAGSVVINDIP